MKYTVHDYVSVLHIHHHKTRRTEIREHLTWKENMTSLVSAVTFYPAIDT